MEHQEHHQRRPLLRPPDPPLDSHPAGRRGGSPCATRARTSSTSALLPASSRALQGTTTRRAPDYLHPPVRKTPATFAVQLWGGEPVRRIPAFVACHSATKAQVTRARNPRPGHCPAFASRRPCYLPQDWFIARIPMTAPSKRGRARREGQSLVGPATAPRRGQPAPRCGKRKTAPLAAAPAPSPALSPAAQPCNDGRARTCTGGDGSAATFARGGLSSGPPCGVRRR